MLRKLASDTAWYGVSSILGRVLNYLLVPLYTAALPLWANGVMTELYGYAAFLNVVFSFGMETAFFRFTRAGDDEATAAQRGQTLIVAVTLGGLALGFATLPWLSAELGYAHGARLLLVLAGMLATDALIAIPMARLRLAGRPRKFAALRLVTICAQVGLNLLFLVVFPHWEPGRQFGAWLGADVQPVLWVFLATLLGNLPYLLFLNLPKLRPGLVLSPAGRQMVVYAFPIVLMGLAGMVNEMLGRLLLPIRLPQGFYPGLNGTQVLGIFGNCYKLSVFMSLAIQAFRLGAEPFFFRAGAADGAAARFALVMRWFVISCTALMLGVGLSLPWLGPLFLRRPIYLQGMYIVPYLLLANLYLGVYYNLSAWFKLTDKTRFGTYISLGGAAITIALNWVLIPVLGYFGSALATLACYFTMAAWCYLAGQRHYPVPYPVWVMVALPFVALAAILGADYVDGYGLIAEVGYRVGVLAGFGGFVWWQVRGMLTVRRAPVG